MRVFKDSRSRVRASLRLAHIASNSLAHDCKDCTAPQMSATSRVRTSRSAATSSLRAASSLSKVLWSSSIDAIKLFWHLSAFSCFASCCDASWATSPASCRSSCFVSRISWCPWSLESATRDISCRNFAARSSTCNFSAWWLSSCFWSPSEARCANSTTFRSSPSMPCRSLLTVSSNLSLLAETRDKSSRKSASLADTILSRTLMRVACILSRFASWSCELRANSSRNFASTDSTAERRFECTFRCSASISLAVRPISSRNAALVCARLL
mmetsp:Transcript_55651/g.148430  ORF Transcript_55651/g.148430 Transcript_55651/m.148430 type:complete len:270 (-) Transcript_55651:2993-3802(-)